MTDFTPKTTFVANLLQMTPWSRRKYIEELLILEQYLERASRGETPAMGWASNMHYGSLKQQYPIETACILAEFSGSPVSWEEFHERLEAYEAQKADEIRQWKKQKEAEQQQEYEAWRKAGGRP